MSILLAADILKKERDRFKMYTLKELLYFTNNKAETDKYLWFF